MLKYAQQFPTGKFTNTQDQQDNLMHIVLTWFRDLQSIYKKSPKETEAEKFSHDDGFLSLVSKDFQERQT